MKWSNIEGSHTEWGALVAIGAASLSLRPLLGKLLPACGYYIGIHWPIMTMRPYDIAAMSPSLAAVVESYEPRWMSKRKWKHWALTGLSECEDGLDSRTYLQWLYDRNCNGTYPHFIGGWFLSEWKLALNYNFYIFSVIIGSTEAPVVWLSKQKVNNRYCAAVIRGLRLTNLIKYLKLVFFIWSCPPLYFYSRSQENHDGLSLHSTQPESVLEISNDGIKGLFEGEKLCF